MTLTAVGAAADSFFFFFFFYLTLQSVFVDKNRNGCIFERDIGGILVGGS
jgi:hypothetical protein